MHPELCKDAAREHHPGKIPVVEGTLIQLRPSRLPGSRELKPMWLRAPALSADPAEVTVLWQAFLRRFDLETGKPQCCHSRGSSALSPVPSRSVVMMAA
jgi:hypothetical protein